MTYKQAQTLRVGDPIECKTTGEVWHVVQTFEMVNKTIGIEFKDYEGYHAVCTHRQVNMLPERYYNREIN